MSKPTASHIAAMHLTKAANSSIIAQVVDESAVWDLQDSLLKLDPQSADLLEKVFNTLSDKLELSDAESYALAYLKSASRMAVTERTLPGVRNTIFKMANSLGIRLPSHLFASTRVAYNPDFKVSLPVKGMSSTPGGKTHTHAVFILENRYQEGGYVVAVEGTPGRWRVEDFMRGHGPVSIDMGQNWDLINADEVRSAVRKWEQSQEDDSASLLRLKREAFNAIERAIDGVYDAEKALQALIDATPPTEVEFAVALSHVQSSLRPLSVAKRTVR